MGAAMTDRQSEDKSRAFICAIIAQLHCLEYEYSVILAARRFYDFAALVFVDTGGQGVLVVRVAIASPDHIAERAE